MGEVKSFISRGDYEGDRRNQLTPSLLADIGSCIMRLLDGSGDDSDATEHGVFITDVLQADDGQSRIEYLVLTGEDDASFGVEAGSRLCTAAGYIIEHCDGEGTGEIADREVGYFIRIGQPPVELALRLQAPEAVMADGRLAAAAA